MLEALPEADQPGRYAVLGEVPSPGMFDFASEHCRWEGSAQQTPDLYHWLLGESPRPAFVTL